MDASFFALVLICCPWLRENLNIEVRKNAKSALKAAITIIPVYTNWMLFTGMVETFSYKYELPYDPVRIEYGIKEFSQHWYVGDWMFSDGMHFAMDYYNSYVIQPYLINMIMTVNARDQSFDWFLPKLKKISERYAELQERSINSDGSFPVFGRSIVYRGGAFHHLADMALRRQLPASLQPGQVRATLYAVMQKILDAPDTFSEDSWLNIGLSGHHTK